jgi:sugar/nucleoside kinase (ribokinase family)
MIGLDGFVDEIIHVVDKREDFEHFDRIPTIAAFGEKVTKAAGLSMNFELIPKKVKLGGNGPIFANGLLEYGVELKYVGALGNPVHPVFQPMAAKSKEVYSLCEPGHTDAMEFLDGKLMLGKYECLSQITWESFKEKLGGAEKIAEIANESDLFGMENWTMIPHMSEIWQGVIDEVIPLMSQKEKKTIAFFDLADPEKRTKEDIKHALSLIPKFNDKFFTILGLNEKESHEIAAVLGVTDNGSLKDLVCGCYEKLGIDVLVVHPRKSAVCCDKNGFFDIDGPYCENPAITTGAGDNFNSGFCFGQSLGLSAQDSLTLGVATSGYYVRNAKSPGFENVLAFLKQWQEGRV